MNCLKTISTNSPSQSRCASIEQARMKRTAEGLLMILEGYLPAGCCEWAAAHRPDIARYLDEAAEKVMSAVNSADRGEFAVAVKYCAGLYCRASELYEQELGSSRTLTFSSSRSVVQIWAG